VAQALQGGKGQVMLKVTPKKWAAKGAKDRCSCGQNTNLGALRSRIRCTNFDLWRAVILQRT
jgi:hypothetical protein